MTTTVEPTTVVDTNRLTRKLLAMGVSPAWLTASEDGQEPEQRVYDIFEMVSETPSGGQVFLGFRLTDLQEGHRGDIYRCVDHPGVPASVERVLDTRSNLRPGELFHFPDYRMDIERLWHYAEELLEGGLADTPAAAIERAIANADRADLILWNWLRDELLELLESYEDDDTEGYEPLDLDLGPGFLAFLPEYFVDMARSLPGTADNLPQGKDGPDLSLHTILLTTAIMALMNQDMSDQELSGTGGNADAEAPVQA